MGGLAVRLNRQGLIHWRCYKQKVVAKSSAEAELIALADHSDTLMTIRILLAELGHTQPPVPVHEDNTAAIQILQDTRYDGRTKHVDYRIKSVRERNPSLIRPLFQARSTHSINRTKSLSLRPLHFRAVS